MSDLRTNTEDEASRPQPRSAEELAMRAHVVAWGRARWPGARVFHELEAGGRRIDLAFILPNDLVGIEIKSSRDTLDRLDAQLRAFGGVFPELWLAMAPKWKDAGVPHPANALVVDPDGIRRPPYGFPPGHRRHYVWPAMLTLLLAPEVRRVAKRCGIPHPARASASAIRRELGFRLAGERILPEVCRELRARKTGWTADPPVPLGE